MHEQCHGERRRLHGHTHTGPKWCHLAYFRTPGPPRAKLKGGPGYEASPKRSWLERFHYTAWTNTDGSRDQIVTLESNYGPIGLYQPSLGTDPSRKPYYTGPTPQANIVPMKGTKVQTLRVYTINSAVHSYSAYIPLHSYRSVEEWKS